jgi:phenylpropionate dioxygenase-like ring-hydroxylating dioxygenase large terminal subunit
MTSNTKGSEDFQWPPEEISSVPFRLYKNEEIYKSEQNRVFGGAVWNFLCLEVEVPNAGDFRTTQVGRMPVVVTRNFDGKICAFENRCAHRGTLIVLEEGGNARDFSCVYHAWNYDLKGSLKGIPFKAGVNGAGGLPESFCMQDHGPRKLRVATICGLVFGTFSNDVPPIEDFIGDVILPRLRRVLGKPVEIIGRFTQVLPYNWKLYAENVRDTYHASLLHTFFTTFRIARLTQAGGIFLSSDGGHHATASFAPKAEKDAAYQSLRSNNETLRLSDPRLLECYDEYNDGIKNQMLTIFPGLVVQQVYNSLALRLIVPVSINSTELRWVYLGYTDDTPELRRARLLQANLIGPAGFVSMEDGCVGNFVERGISTAQDKFAVVQMGGLTAESQPTRATEVAVRGFWKAYRSYMGV